MLHKSSKFAFITENVGLQNVHCFISQPKVYKPEFPIIYIYIYILDSAYDIKYFHVFNFANSLQLAKKNTKIIPHENQQVDSTMLIIENGYNMHHILLRNK